MDGPDNGSKERKRTSGVGVEMIYFLAPCEGGLWVKINRPSLRPKSVINHVLKNKGWGVKEHIALFKNGIIYDSNLIRRGINPLIHKKVGGRKEGKKLYKKLLTLKIIPEETVWSDA